MFYFLLWTLLLGFSLARLVRPTVPATLGWSVSDKQREYHDPKKVEFWAAVTLFALVFWFIQGLVVAGAV